MENKTCTVCGLEKDIDFFPKNKHGHDSRCKECRNEYLKNYRNLKDNKIKAKEYNEIYRKNNVERIDKSRKKFLSTEKGVDSRKKSIKKFNLSDKRQICISKFNNSQKRRDYAKKWHKDKRDNDLEFRIKTTISANIRNHIKKGTKKHTVKYLDYKINELIVRLEVQFIGIMDWSNYGSYWEIDHIIPQSFFDFSKEEEIKKCWDLRNLRPLNKIENIIKSNKIDMELILDHNISDLLQSKL